MNKQFLKKFDGLLNYVIVGVICVLVGFGLGRVTMPTSEEIIDNYAHQITKERIHDGYVGANQIGSRGGGN